MKVMGCLAYFTELWNERVKLPVKTDLVSMLAHGEATRNMPPMEYLGNLVLLIVGGNDTTRSTMTASALWAAPASGPIHQIAGETGPDRFHGGGDHSLADAAGAYAPHVQVDTELGGRRSRPATR